MKTKQDFTPVYYQLAENLKQQIASGQLKPGDMIPSESQLGAEYGISRMTVRRGLALLLESGLIETVRGKGNFVAQPQLHQATITFEEDALVNGQRAKIKLIGINVSQAKGDIARQLHLAEGTKVFVIRRLITSEGKPVGFDIKHIPYIKGKPLLENVIEYAYFPDIVAQHTDVMIYRIERSFAAISLRPEEARLLQTGTDHPALCVTQVIYAKEDRPLGISKTIYRGEAYNLKTVSYPYSGV